MSQVLVDHGADLLEPHEGTERLIADAGRLRPDVVVLGVDGGLSRELGIRIRRATPASTVILWPRDEAELEVLDPGAAPPRRVAPPLPDALLEELGRSQRSLGRE
jgi:hypothetical protein